MESELSSGLLAAILIAALLVLLIIGTPVGIALILLACIGMYAFGGWSFVWVTMQTLPYAQLSSYTFVVIPMFLLMGTVAARIGIVNALYVAVFRIFSRVKGSVFLATVVTSTGFAALSGSTVVNSAVFTRISLPEIIRLGFDKRLGAGCIAAAGTLAAMIPPSIVMVLYGTITKSSIGALLIAGIIPGIITAVSFCIGIYVISVLRPELSPPLDVRFSLREKLEPLKSIWPLAILVFIMIYGIYAGIMPPSAAGGVGAFATIALGFLYRKLTLPMLWSAVAETARMTAVLLIIILGGLLFSRMLVVTGIMGDVIGFVGGLDISPTVFILLIILFYLVLGMFIDAISMIVMTLPFVFPLVINLGYDPIWFGILVVKLCELGTITPPVGINLFAVVAASQGRIKPQDAMAGVWPFVIIDLIIIAGLVAFPQIVTGIIPDHLG